MRSYLVKSAAIIGCLATLSVTPLLAPTASAQEHYKSRTIRRCDSDGDRCASYRCDRDGDDCVQTSAWHARYTTARYSRSRYHDVQRCDRDRDHCATYRCDGDGDQCKRISGFYRQ